MEFSAAVASILGPFRRLRGALKVFVPVMEAAVAAAILLPGSVGRLGAAGAAAAVVALSSTLIRRDLSTAFSKSVWGFMPQW